ncbi:hypothetical protein [Sulfurospirillum sp. 1612]|uniref:hypothetical protein n=1 Tax=Sulfurospirillum sp. 1612 TaxID=3094835 RepID=UPI002F92540A
MSKISLQIGTKDFDIKVDGDFYEFFEKDLKKTFKSKRNIDIKDLLSAYVQKIHNEYENKLQIQEMLSKIAELDEIELKS